MNERTEQIKAAMADEAFVKACIEAENEEAVQKLFAEKGIEMSLTEIELMKEMVCAVGEGKITEEQLEKLANGGELSEEELGEAAGGAWYDVFFKYSAQVEDGVQSISGDLYRSCKDMMPELYSKSLSAAGWGAAIVGGLGAAYGIAKACGVDVEGGIKSAYNWVADKVTSRW